MFTPKGISPRFDISSENFENISKALETVGHVVLENVFDEPPLRQTKNYTEAIFREMRNRFKNDPDILDTEIAEVMGGTSSFASNPEGRKHCKLFMDMITRSRILNLYSFLFDGNVAAVHGPVLRHVDPNTPLRYIGLHPDAQTKHYLTPRNPAIYTMWTPLNDIDDDTPGLLLVHKKFRLNESNTGTSLAERDSTVLREMPQDGEPFNHIEFDLDKLHLSGQPRKKLDPEEIKTLDQASQQILKDLIHTLGDKLYAPKLKKGGVILFRHDVVHGSFSHPNLNTPRTSVDIRFMSEASDCTIDETHYAFRQHDMKTYDPVSKNLVDLETVEALRQLQNKTKQLENTLNSITSSTIFIILNALTKKLRSTKKFAKRLLGTQP